VCLFGCSVACRLYWRTFTQSIWRNYRMYARMVVEELFKNFLFKMTNYTTVRFLHQCSIVSRYSLLWYNTHVDMSYTYVSKWCMICVLSICIETMWMYVPGNIIIYQVTLSCTCQWVEWEIQSYTHSMIWLTRTIKYTLQFDQTIRVTQNRRYWYFDINILLVNIIHMCDM